MQGQEDKLREIRQDYSKRVKEHNQANAQAVAYRNLTTEQADPVVEEVRKAVLNLSEKGYLETLASFTQQALAVQNFVKKDKE